MADSAVKLIGFWASPLALRIEWALKLKHVDYEYIEEAAPSSSPLILKYNPVHKKIPVLIHKGEPLPESLVILEYIEETWKEKYQLLPKDPHDRATARFWAKFADEKCLPLVVKTLSKTGWELEKAVKEAGESLKTLEEGLKGNMFFGGNQIGFADIVAGWFAYWVPLIEEILGLPMVEEEEAPFLKKWFHDFLEVAVVKENQPPRDKLLPHMISLRQSRLAASNVNP